MKVVFTNCFDKTIIHKCFHCFPSITWIMVCINNISIIILWKTDITILKGYRPVYEIQVKIIES